MNADYIDKSNQINEQKYSKMKLTFYSNNI